jgi:DUF1680 family protein
MKRTTLLIASLGLSWATAHAQKAMQQLEPVNFSKVLIDDEFWKPKMDMVATTSLQACIYQTETATPRIRNFQKVARNKGEQHEGIFYDDSDVFKALEAMAYSIRNHRDTALERKADEWIDIVAAAQQPDGYLNTWYTLRGLNERWTDMSMHEDYNGGHMIEAAVAYYEATGKRKFLDVTIRWADHFDSLFGPGKRHWVTGHEELELALVKLYQATGNRKYLDLSHWLLEERGRGLAKGYTWTDWKDTGYAQDLVPVREQKEITGHAVRAMYLYTGAADVAALTGDSGYVTAMRTVWQDVVYRNMYITGGIGSAGNNEGFTTDYDLPNEQAYCETCASVGMVFWNQRMNSLTGESEYIDVLERSLYNGALDGLSLSGDKFFYGNALASRGQHNRRAWFGTACCPANIARLVASLGNYVYGHSNEGIWVNLFVGSQTILPIGKTTVALRQMTRYPQDGNVTFHVDPAAKTKMALHIRIPGWARGIAAPGGLYQFADQTEMPVTITLNGKPFAYSMEKGYALIDREWKKGDVVTMQIPMPVRRVTARAELKQNNGRIALQRGPLVYCVEGADNNGEAWNIIVPEGTHFTETAGDVAGEKITALDATLPVLLVSADGNSVNTENRKVRAIPYYTWCNRGSNAMQVWLPVKIKDIKINY